MGPTFNDHVPPTLTMATVVEAFRLCLLGAGTITPAAVGISVAITLVVLFSGVFIFQRTERTFIDTV